MISLALPILLGLPGHAAPLLPHPARLLVDVATVVAAPEVADPTMDAAVSLLVNDSEVGDIVQAMRERAATKSVRAVRSFDDRPSQWVKTENFLAKIGISLTRPRRTFLPR